MYNVSLCSFGNTIDKLKVEKEWSNREGKMKQEGFSESEINLKRKNLLDAQRQYIENSFIFN